MILIIYMGFLRIMVLHESAELYKLAQGWIANYRLVDNGEQNGSGQQEPEYGEKGKTVFWSRHHFFIYFPHGSSFLEGVSDGSGVPLEWLLKVAVRLQESEKGVQWVYYPDKEKPEAVYAVLALSLPPNAGVGWLLVGEDVTDYWLLSVRFRNSLFLLAGMLVLLAGTVGHFFSRRAIVPIVEAYEKERTFLVDASHELRAPLSVVQASLEVLEEIKEKFPPFYQQVFSDMVDEVQRMQRLVQDLFWLARHERGLLSRQEEAVELCDLALKVFHTIVFKFA